MSAFLGPIHVKMYGRILAQDEASAALLALAEDRGWAGGLREFADTEAPAASTEPLETIIDQSNIHGWLNQAVVLCERRFALLVSAILDGHPERLADLKRTMEGIGRQYGALAQPDAERAFSAIHDVLLDGMPCDFPFDVINASSDEVVWRVTSCPHAPYWAARGCDGETYYVLRDAWFEGALNGSGIEHSRQGRCHALRKEC